KEIWKPTPGPSTRPGGPRELLGEVIGGVGVANDAEQIAIDSPAVTLHEHLLGGTHGIGLALVSLQDHRPDSRNAAEAFVGDMAHHERVSSALPRVLCPGMRSENGL